MNVQAALAVLDHYIEIFRDDERFEQAHELSVARTAFANLAAAATEVRDVAWGPGETDQPHIVRLNSAL